MKIRNIDGLSADDLQQLAALTRNTDIVILSDEVYEHVVFDEQPHHGMATHPQLAERSVIISSFGKTYHVTGWRVGYCVAPSALMVIGASVHPTSATLCVVLMEGLSMVVSIPLGHFTTT